MKTGYSNLLGEFVDATQVVHEDTTPFQIVCPCCKDPLFKVVRPAETAIEYFSHHKAPKEVVADCELRVGGISSEERRSSDAASRGQTLKAFQSVLRDALGLEGIYSALNNLTPAEIRRQVLLESGPKAFVEIVSTHLVDGEFKERAESAADQYLGMLARSSLELSTTFSIGVQRRIAIDLAKHLAAPSSARTRTAIVTHSALMNMQNYAGMDPRDIAGYPHMQISQRFYAELQKGPRHLLDKYLLNQKTTAILLDGMEKQILGTLMRLPYFDMLRNYRAGRPLLEGIAAADPKGMLGLARVAS